MASELLPAGMSQALKSRFGRSEGLGCLSFGERRFLDRRSTIEGMKDRGKEEEDEEEVEEEEDPAVASSRSCEQEQQRSISSTR